MNTNKLKNFRDKHVLLYHLCLIFLTFIGILLISLFLIKLYTHHGKETALPDFRGQSLEEIKHNSTYSKFEFIVIDSTYDSNKKPGVILEQNPIPQELVKSGRKVYVSIAISDPPTIMMPNLINLSLRQAERILKEFGLKINPIIYKASPYENAVLEQLYQGRNIAPDKAIKLGESITLIVGKKIGSEDNDLLEIENNEEE